MDIFLIIILKLYFQLKVRKNTHFKLIVLTGHILFSHLNDKQHNFV